MLIWFALIQFASSDHYVSNIEQNCRFLVLFCLPPIWHVVNANIPNFFNMKIIQYWGNRAWEAFVEEKTTKGYIFKPLPKVFKLRILSGCWGLVWRCFQLNSTKSQSVPLLQPTFSLAPLGQTRKLSISTYFHFQTIFNNFPTIFFENIEKYGQNI